MNFIFFCFLYEILIPSIIILKSEKYIFLVTETFSLYQYNFYEKEKEGNENFSSKKIVFIGKFFLFLSSKIWFQARS